MRIGAGLEYGLSEKILVSAGYLYAKPGVSKDYQTDISFALKSSTVAGGLGFKITEKIMVNAGVSYSMYTEETETNRHTFPAAGNPEIETTDTYFKDTLILAIGLDFSF